MHHNITALRSYRATLIPHGVDTAQLDQLADARLLPVLRLKAASASHAQACALLACKSAGVEANDSVIYLMAIDGAINQDLPRVLGVVLLGAVSVTLMNLLVDVVYAYLDPRVRYG